MTTIREIVANRKPKPDAPPPVGGGVTTAPKPPKDPPVKVRLRCGCERTLHDLKQGDCARHAAEKRQAKAHKKQQADRQKQAESDGRLPDLSRFVCSFKASPAPEWTATLELSSGQYFEAKGSALEKTQRACYRLYREWAAQQPAQGEPD